ncbi:MAG: PepSY domain-containing protein, partial [Steroidobacteraceae bacterium]
MRAPHSVWLRRALFQLHLWTGIGVGLYIFVVSLSGSAIVFRRELDKALCPRTIMVRPVGPRMSDAQLLAAALAAFPRARLRPRIEIRGPRVPGAAVEVW